MGGDEFVIVVPGLGPDAALVKAESLHELAASIGQRICGENLLGLSVGTAFCPEDGNDAEQLLAEADRRMYSVKQTHRDRTIKSEPAQLGFANNGELETLDS